MNRRGVEDIMRDTGIHLERRRIAPQCFQCGDRCFAIGLIARSMARTGSRAFGSGGVIARVKRCEFMYRHLAQRIGERARGRCRLICDKQSDVHRFRLG